MRTINNKRFQSSYNSFGTPKSHIHDFINRHINGGQISFCTSYLDGYSYCSGVAHLHMGWLDGRDNLVWDRVRDYCLVLTKMPLATQRIDKGFVNTTDCKNHGGVSHNSTDSRKLKVLIRVFKAIDDTEDGSVDIISLLIRLQGYDE